MSRRVCGVIRTQCLFGGEGEVVLLADRHRNRPRTGEFDHRAIDRKTRIRIQNVGARLAEHHDRHEHRRLAAGKDHHRPGRNLDLESPVQIGRDRFAQRQNADRGRVAVVAVAKRLGRRVDNEIRRAKIGLADPEIDDVATLGRERGRARQHRECIFFTETIEGGNCFEHDSLQPNRAGNANFRGPSLLHCNMRLPATFCFFPGGRFACGSNRAYLCVAGESVRRRQ